MVLQLFTCTNCGHRATLEHDARVFCPSCSNGEMRNNGASVPADLFGRLPWYGDIPGPDTPGPHWAPPRIPEPPGPLPRLAAAVERVAAHLEKKDQRWEQARAENWERIKSQPLTVDVENHPCIFCGASSLRVMRGPQILGCVACFRAALGVK